VATAFVAIDRRLACDEARPVMIRMARFAWLMGVLLVPSLVFGPERAAAREAGRGKNVVLVVADDLGLEVGCYGHPVAKTPSMDALAARGVRFTNGFCTTSSCSASRSVILTGLYNHANGQYGHQHAEHNFHTFESLEAVPVLLAKAGYRTAYVGKYHVQPESVYHFDANLNDQPAYRFAFHQNQDDKIPGGARNSVGMADRVKSWLSRVPDQPFFLYFCPTDPHRAARGFANEQAAKWPGNTPVVYDPATVLVPPFLPDTPACRVELAEYLQAVSRLDQGLGRLMEVLEETGHKDDTLVIFLSDNGIPWPGAKTTLYEPGVRLPLIVSGPGVAVGQTCDALVTWADVVPTILAFAGAKGPAYPLQGRSFLPQLEKPDTPGAEAVFLSHTFHEVTNYYPMRAVRTARYKLIRNLAHGLSFPFASDLWESDTWQDVERSGRSDYGRRTVDAYLNRPEYELYDLETDPDETKNLAGSADHAVTLALLKKRLTTWQTETKDPWIVKDRHE
jgi:N-sulfoglucosamine sulfohydrolase